MKLIFNFNKFECKFQLILKFLSFYEKCKKFNHFVVFHYSGTSSFLNFR